jgi:pentatricopeptide repeat protein
MKENGITPDENTYYYLLQACAKSGQLDAAEDVLERMRHENLIPQSKHFICLGLAFARRGEIEATEKVMETVVRLGGDPHKLQNALKNYSQRRKT